MWQGSPKGNHLGFPKLTPSYKERQILGKKILIDTGEEKKCFSDYFLNLSADQQKL